MQSSGQCLITGVSGTEFVAQLLTGHPALSSTLYHVDALRFVPSPAQFTSGVARRYRKPSFRTLLSPDATMTALWLRGVRENRTTA